jgi:uncharacterized protein YbbC (DUF1343 family)
MIKIFCVIVLILTLSFTIAEKKRLLIGGSLDQNSHIINLISGKKVAIISAAGYFII